MTLLASPGIALLTQETTSDEGPKNLYGKFASSSYT